MGQFEYRKKPVVIEAFQVLENDDDDDDGNTTAYPQWLFDNFQSGVIYHNESGMRIKTLEGDHHVSPNDYIIRGVKGELYPCKPDIFAATYDKVE